MTGSRRIPGRQILHDVSTAYAHAYAPTLRERGARVVIVRFTTSSNDPIWAARMEASRISATQKARLFTTLGADADQRVVPDTFAPNEFEQILTTANADTSTVGIIVQTPVPAHLADLVELIDPAEDLDALTTGSPHPACATADGIVRIAEPFLPGRSVAVVDYLGFVGAGVTDLLHAAGHDPLLLDRGDDLRSFRNTDIVLTTTGVPGLLTTDHITARHHLVVDAGFTPTTDASRRPLPRRSRAPPSDHPGTRRRRAGRDGRSRRTTHPAAHHARPTRLAISRNRPR